MAEGAGYMGGTAAGGSSAAARSSASDTLLAIAGCSLDAACISWLASRFGVEGEDPEMAFSATRVDGVLRNFDLGKVPLCLFVRGKLG